MVDEAHIGKCSWTAYEDETRRWNVNRVRKRIARHDDDDRLHNGIANETDEPHAAVCRKVYRHASDIAGYNAFCKFVIDF